MAIPPNKHLYTQAFQIASLIASRLEPHCRRIEIAGSLRRQRPTIGDIELIAIAKTYFAAPVNLEEQLAGHGRVRNQLHEHLDTLIREGKITYHLTSAGARCWGDRLRKFTLTTNLGVVYKVDLFMCEDADWGNTFVIRTGSADFSHWLVTQRASGGAMPPNMHHAENRLWRDGQAIVCFEEVDFFAALGLPYIPPQFRDDDAWVAYLKSLEM